MSNQRTIRAVIPVLPDMDMDQVLWHTRESIETTAAADGLTVVAVTSAVIPVDALPKDPNTGVPLAAANLDRPLAEYTFCEFVATVERPEADTSNPPCGYCGHPSHADGKCEHPAPDWLGGPDALCTSCPGDADVRGHKPVGLH
ncbi:Uncharacterised protein [Mycobacteroides abscessus subsp. abscessus]|uniref:hypothetical protein n=1 Tax=Mycobacteroides abscessus TaxID=36809 RepID=UPI00078B4D12|nr:hypothetical protein [Mycobacteroides abscessus]WJJ56150.1 hypothetical protein PROPHIT371_68 [Mycobacterium phage prophiT37-1]AMU58985.1 hypothetical protein A3O03_01485 [Mycobacteroides abscessus]AMU73479.1 hypothetical protein A3O06_01400 [Mycobacteroides abscessus]ANO22421.1 hypothetical protein BAB79_01400 [Mycobacteroides abscessus]MDQ8120538.1 hypothetical protein [Mycobacteroides abscessus subsp. massiliense]